MMTKGDQEGGFSFIPHTNNAFFFLLAFFYLKKKASSSSIPCNALLNDDITKIKHFNQAKILDNHYPLCKKIVLSKFETNLLHSIFKIKPKPDS